MPTKDIQQFRELISEHQKRPEHVVPICLRGDIDSQIVDLDSQLLAIKQGLMDDRLTGNPVANELSRKHDELRAEAEKYTAHVYMRGMPKKDWADLVAAHPGGPGETFSTAIWNKAVPASIFKIRVQDGEYELDPETLDKFLEGVTDGQWDLLAGGAAKVNIGDGTTPFSVLASKARPNSDEASKPPEPGE